MGSGSNSPTYATPAPTKSPNVQNAPTILPSAPTAMLGGRSTLVLINANVTPLSMPFQIATLAPFPQFVLHVSPNSISTLQTFSVIHAHNSTPLASHAQVPKHVTPVKTLSSQQ